MNKPPFSFNLDEVLCKDRFFLQKGFRQPEKFGGLLKIQAKYQKSHALYLQRKNALPKPAFNQNLPVYQSLDEIKHAIQNNQVVIVCGETGSGKTQQPHALTINSLDVFLSQSGTSLLFHVKF